MDNDSLIDKTVFYFGSRQVVLTGLVLKEDRGMYQVRDDSSGIVHQVHESQILEIRDKLV